MMVLSSTIMKLITVNYSLVKNRYSFENFCCCYKLKPRWYKFERAYNCKLSVF